MDFLNAFLTVVLVLVSLFMILLVLMQRGNANGGLGAAMGGGMAEAALGAETSSVLSKWTRNTAIVFFILTFGLYLSKLHQYEVARDADAGALPEIEGEQASPANDMLQQLMMQSEAVETEAENADDAAVPAGEATEVDATETPADQ